MLPSQLNASTKGSFRALFERAENWGDGAFQLLDWLAEAQGSFKECNNLSMVWGSDRIF